MGMMNEVTAAFIRQHADDDVRQLALKGGQHPGVDMPLALQQIVGRQTARQKLPSWAVIDELLYPPHLSMEQCSSEQTARYKAQLAARLCADFVQKSRSDDLKKVHLPHETEPSLVDLTGGFGVDFSFMARQFERCIYVERQQALCEMAQHNFSLLGLRQVEVVCADGVDYLQRMNHATVIYLDPARRDRQGGKTVAISDCTPDLLSLKEQLTDKSLFVMVKLSPMLDWHQAVAQLETDEVKVCEIHVLSVRNECKELLFVLSKQRHKPLTLHCVNDDQAFVCSADEPSDVPPPYVSPEEMRPGQYLYEPHASIMKAGCFSAVSVQLDVRKIAPNSHLFISERDLPLFPGRKFRIQALSSMNKKELKSVLRDVRQANITTRNFPLSVAELRKRLKLKDGGAVYIFATTLADGRHVLLICSK